MSGGSACNAMIDPAGGFLGCDKSSQAAAQVPAQWPPRSAAALYVRACTRRCNALSEGPDNSRSQLFAEAKAPAEAKTVTYTQNVQRHDAR